MAYPLIVVVGGGLLARIVARAAARAAVREGIKRLPQAPIPKAPPPAPVTGTKPKPPQTTTAPAPVTPPVPLPTPQPSKGNTRPVGHDGKEDDKKKCEKELEKYPVHAHKNKGDHILAGSKKQSHHVVQNAQFMKNGKAVATICENYKYGDAPCIPLKGPSTDRTTPHGRATKMQEADALASKASGVPITYGDAKKNSRKQLLHAGLTPEEVECVMTVVDAMIRAMCKDITDSTILRTPGGD